LLQIGFILHCTSCVGGACIISLPPFQTLMWRSSLQKSLLCHATFQKLSIDEKIQTAPVHLRFGHHQSSLSQDDRDHGRGDERPEQGLKST